MNRTATLALAALLLGAGAAHAQFSYHKISFSHATDCTNNVTGKDRQLCVDLDDGALWRCEPSAGDCDTAGEWKAVGGGGGDWMYPFIRNNPGAAEDFLWFRAPRAMTVTGIDCIVAATTSAQATVKECDANGGSCTAIEAVITCGTTNTTEASTIDNASIDAGDWVRVEIGTVSGSPGHLSLTMEGTW